MLVLTTKNPAGFPSFKEWCKKEISWFVIEKVRLTEEDILNVDVVAANGPELFWISLHLDGLPMVNRTEYAVRWFGDHAKFIAASLPSSIPCQLKIVGYKET